MGEVFLLNSRLKRLLQPNTRFYFIFLIIFAVATLIFGEHRTMLFIIEAVVIVLLFYYSSVTGKTRSREIVDYLESITLNMDSSSNEIMVNFPLPMAIFSLDDNRIISANENFFRMTGDRKHTFESHMEDMIPGFNYKWLMDGRTENPNHVKVGEQTFKVFGNIIRNSEEDGTYKWLGVTYWVDITEYADLSEEFADTRPVFSIIMLDNYEELLNDLSEKDKSAILSMIDERISDWADKCDGYLKKYDRDRYIFIFEEQYLQSLVDDKFSILDSVRSVTAPNGIQPTLSIGIGKDGRSMSETYQYSSLSLDMALSRGGDQAVIKNRFNFEFYGGKTAQLEKRTKVKSRVMANSVGELIHESSKVYIMGHKFSDFDSLGAAIGISCIARKREKEVKIVVNLSTSLAMPIIRKLEDLPEYRDIFIDPQEAILEADGGTLLVIVDTNRPEQVESKTLLEACNSVAVIDHHRRAGDYIQNAGLSFHEPYASSTCELVTELLQYVVDPADILRVEAEALLAGIMLDTKNFTMRTGGRTFDAAAFLRRAGADTTEVKKLLQTDMASTKEKYSIIQKAKIYKSGIAIAAPEEVSDRVIPAQAADELLEISGINASFVVFPMGDRVNISARSAGDINVQLIVEKLGGGGSRLQAGAQIPDKTLKDVVTDLLAAIDEYMDGNS